MTHFYPSFRASWLRLSSIVGGSDGIVGGRFWQVGRPAETAFSTRKSKESDVYSYGIVLLELITRRMPLDPSFPEATDIVSWVKFATSNDAENINAVVDPLLWHQFIDSRIMEEVGNVLVLALKCTENGASDRPSMRDVVTQLIDVKAHARRFSDV